MHRFQRWRAALQAAGTQADVERVMRDYLSVLEPRTLELLPPECQAALKERDIQSAAVSLLHCEMRFSGSDELRQLLHEIAHTYAAASTRITAINKGPLVPSSE